MGKLMCAVAVTVALVAGLARGEDDGGGRAATNPRVKKPKADTEAPKEVEPRAVTATKTGTLAEKPVNAADGVIAVLKVKPEAPVRRERGPRTKKAVEAPKEVVINLKAANPDVAVKIKELTAKSASVTVTGSLLEDTMKVTEVALADDKAATEKKPKADKAKDQ